MNMKLWLPLGLALVMGIVAAKVGLDMMQSNRSGPPKDVQTVTVVVAAKDLEPGQSLTEADLKVQTLPATAAPANAIRATGDAVGRVTAVAVANGQALFDGLLVAQGAGAGVQALVPSGMRAVTLEVNEFSGVGGMLLPGCRVDVISSLRDERTGRQVVRTIVDNVRVVAVGQRLTAPKTCAEDSNANNNNQIRSITLLVPTKDARSIELATNAGRTRLVLRGSFDNLPSDDRALTVAELMGQPRQDEVAPAGAAPTTGPAVALTVSTTRPALDDGSVVRRSVEVIRGTQESKVEFVVPARPAARELITDTDTAPVIPDIDSVLPSLLK